MRLYKRLFVPDSHWPFIDRKAWNCMVSVAEAFRPDEIVILGDFWDCYCISDYTKDPARNFKLLEEELIEGRVALDELERKTKAKSMVFLQGNHEQRIDRYVATFAGKLGDFIQPKEVLKIPNYYKWYPYGMRGHHRMGKLIATHGSLTNKHVAYGMVAKYGASVLFGHTHKIQEFQVRNINGEVHRGINIGWLGDVDRAAEYVKNVADWCHGFALGWFKPNGEFWTQTIPIIRGECVYGDALITASK